MKILLVAHSFPRHVKDMAGAFLLALARDQRAMGHDVLVVAPHAAGLPMEESLDGVRVRRYRYAPDADETLAYEGTMHEQVLRSWSARLRLVRFLAAGRRAVREAIGDFAPDVVHVHWWFPGALTLWPGRARPPMVLTSHGTDLFLLDRFAPLRLLARPIFRAAAEVTVISSPLVERAERLGVARERITVVPMPYDPALTVAQQGVARDPGMLLFVGRLVERKGAAFALRALAELRRRGRELRLLIVGDGPERAALEQLAAELQVTRAVKFAGRLAPADVGRLYARAAVFVMPAVTDWKGEQEGFGMVLVEAMASGLPVVATRSGGIPDIVRDGENGFLVPERDPVALADAVEWLFIDPAIAERLARTAQRDVAERFAPRAIAATFDGVYRRAAGLAT